MKKKLSLFLAFVMTFGTLQSAICVNASETKGMTFQQQDCYQMDAPLAVTPKTFEAEVYFPADMSAEICGGVIVGNYYDVNPCINFQIENGYPSLYMQDSSKTIYDWDFTDVNLYNGEWTHVAITVETDKVCCYINGELKQTITATPPEKLVYNKQMVLGGDLRSSNEMYFRGRLGSVALYSDVRSQEELLVDVTSYGTEDRILEYDTENVVNGDEVVTDKTGNGYNARLRFNLKDVEEPTTNYDFSFAVVGDTQIITEKNSANLPVIYDWIKENVTSKKMKFVLGLGDMTNNDTDWEWGNVKTNVQKLDGVVPYSIIRGNHDSTEQFTATFPYSEYENVIGGSYDGTMSNTWQEVTVGDLQYLILALDYYPSDEVIEWAGGVVEAHPNHQVIITTHSYLFIDGTTVDMYDQAAPAGEGSYNNGDQMWDKLVRKYENIILVLSGHICSEDVLVTEMEGDNGNTVTQMLINPQGVDDRLLAAGMEAPGNVAMLYFSENGKKVEVQYYSTVYDKLTMDSFTLDIGTKSESDMNLLYTTGATVPWKTYTDTVESSSVTFDSPVSVTKLRVKITKLSTAKMYKLSEVEILDTSGNNIASNATVQVNGSMTTATDRRTDRLTDGYGGSVDNYAFWSNLERTGSTTMIPTDEYIEFTFNEEVTISEIKFFGTYCYEESTGRGDAPLGWNIYGDTCSEEKMDLLYTTGATVPWTAYDSETYSGEYESSTVTLDTPTTVTKLRVQITRVSSWNKYKLTEIEIFDTDGNNIAKQNNGIVGVSIIGNGNMTTDGDKQVSFVNDGLDYGDNVTTDKWSFYRRLGSAPVDEYIEFTFDQAVTVSELRFWSSYSYNGNGGGDAPLGWDIYAEMVTEEEMNLLYTTGTTVPWTAYDSETYSGEYESSTVTLDTPATVTKLRVQITRVSSWNKYKLTEIEIFDTDGNNIAKQNNGIIGVSIIGNGNMTTDGDKQVSFVNDGLDYGDNVTTDKWSFYRRLGSAPVDEYIEFTFDQAVTVSEIRFWSSYSYNGNDGGDAPLGWDIYGDMKEETGDDIVVPELVFINDEYQVNYTDWIIHQIPVGTTASEFLNQIDVSGLSGDVRLTEQDGADITNIDSVEGLKTGTKLVVGDGTEETLTYEIAVFGDVDCDGDATIADTVLTKQYEDEKVTLTLLQQYAAGLCGTYVIGESGTLQWNISSGTESESAQFTFGIVPKDITKLRVYINNTGIWNKYSITEIKLFDENRTNVAKDATVTVNSHMRTDNLEHINDGDEKYSSTYTSHSDLYTTDVLTDDYFEFVWDSPVTIYGLEMICFWSGDNAPRNVDVRYDFEELSISRNYVNSEVLGK